MSTKEEESMVRVRRFLWIFSLLCLLLSAASAVLAFSSLYCRTNIPIIGQTHSPYISSGIQNGDNTVRTKHFHEKRSENTKNAKIANIIIN